MTEERQQIDRISTEVSAQETLLDQALAAIANKAAGGGGASGEESAFAFLNSGTITGSNLDTITIPHASGKIPKLIYIYATGSRSSYQVIVGVYISMDGVMFDGGIVSSASSNTTISTSFPVDIQLASAWTESSATLTSVLGSSYKFLSTKTYKWRAYG